jgi:glycerol-3-phosphate O-acyltransferase/dihydroxyacetone phosphate acyltransferase
MRPLLLSLLRGLLRFFFRSVESTGSERIPADGAVIFVMNHPNGLIDPLLLLCFASRPVSFLAKAPLFRLPIVGTLTRAMGSIPVYRTQDGEVTPEQRRATFEAAGSALRNGKAIGIFPEGTTHSDSSLRVLRPGAARIALMAAREGLTVAVVPAGLHYSRKERFRSSALIIFGSPVAALTTSGPQPLMEEVAALTDSIDAALDGVTLQAESHDVLALIEKAERILSGGGTPIAQRVLLRQGLAAGYLRLRSEQPLTLAEIEQRVEGIDRSLDAIDLDPEDLRDRRRNTFLSLAAVLILALPTAVGMVFHAVFYLLIDFLAKRLARGEKELVGTLKLMAGAVLYPMLWIGVAVAAARWGGLGAGGLSLLLLPLCGAAAILFLEALSVVTRELRTVSRQTRDPAALARIEESRAALRQRISQIREKLERRI